MAPVAGDELEPETFQLLMDTLGVMSISQSSMAAAAAAGDPATRRRMKHAKMSAWLAASVQGLHALPEWQLAEQQRSLEDHLFCPGSPSKMEHGQACATSGSKTRFQEMFPRNHLDSTREERMQAERFHQHLLRGHVPEVQAWRHIPGVATLQRPPLEYPCTILVNPQGNPTAAWQQPGCATERLQAWAKHMPSASVTIHLFLGHFNLRPPRKTQVFQLGDVGALLHTIPKYALVGLVDAMDGMPAAEEHWQQQQAGGSVLVDAMDGMAAAETFLQCAAQDHGQQQQAGGPFPVDAMDGMPAAEEHWQQQRQEALSRSIRPCRIVQSTRLVYSDEGAVAPSALLGFVQVSHLPSCKQGARPVIAHMFDIPLDWSQGPPRSQYGDQVLTFEKEYQDLGEREFALVRELYERHHSSRGSPLPGTRPGGGAQIAAGRCQDSPIAAALDTPHLPADSAQATTDRTAGNSAFPGACAEDPSELAQVAVNTEPGSQAVAAPQSASAEKERVALEKSPGDTAAKSDRMCDYVLPQGAPVSLLKGAQAANI